MKNALHFLLHNWIRALIMDDHYKAQCPQLGCKPLADRYCDLFHVIALGQELVHDRAGNKNSSS